MKTNLKRLLYDTLRLCLDWWYVMEWSGTLHNYIPLFGFAKVNGVEWNTMKLIPSNTTQTFNFSFPQFGVYPMD